MSFDSASPSGSSDQSFSALHRTRDASSDFGKAESSTNGRKREERSDLSWKSNLESVLHPTSSGNNASRSYPVERDDGAAAVSTKDWSSGGFLLDSPSIPSRLAFLSRKKNEGSKAKGKSRRDGSGLKIPKRKNRHSHRSSIGSSPLATKVSTLEHEADVRTDGAAPEEPDSLPSLVSGNSSVNSTNLLEGSSAMPPKTKSSGAGYDTDPMQIVNMALSLSEGRRRQISSMRLAAGDTGVRRSISSGQNSELRAARPQSGLGHHLNAERQFSRNISPLAHARRQPTPIKISNQPEQTSDSYLQSHAAHQRGSDLYGGLYNISDASVARVHKAKDHFELLYEYRRLLTHLPPLRGSTQALRKSDIQGRAYNPLQYARNRKVRFQEKRPVQSETDGWHDVPQVRAWVNAIIEAHTERRTDPDECIRLPELHTLHPEPNQTYTDPVEVDTPSPVILKHDADHNSKPRRPRSDWVVLPQDLLADIHWMEQGLNKTKIEDRDGNRIYPWDIELKYTGWRNRTPAHGQGQQVSSAPPEPVEDNTPKMSSYVTPPELPTFASTGRKGKRRGRGRRQEPKLHSDLDSDTSNSDGQKRRKRLQQTLLRSFSKSSTPDSDDKKAARTRKQRPGKTEVEESATEGNPLDSHMRSMLDHERHFSGSPHAEKPESSVERSRSTVKHRIRHDLQISPSRERASSSRRRESDHGVEPLHNSLGKRRQSRLSPEVERPARSSLDYDTPPPSSPSIHQFPSIAINLSPPPSRSPSPTKKVLHSRINPFRDRNHSKQRSGIDAADFADATASPLSQQKSTELAKDDNPFVDGSRDTSPMTSLAKHTSNTSATRGDAYRNHSSASKQAVKPPVTADAQARVRGLFKGGRIAELLGNEVSRVGDLLWKREVAPATRTSSSSSGVRSHPGTDMDEARATSEVLKKPPQPHSSRFSSPTGRASKNASSAQLRSACGDKHSYFMSNLPSFTSPFQKDRELQEERDRVALVTPESSPPDAYGAPDHISQAAALHRSVSRSARLDRLAPPKLNISRSASPDGSPESRRANHEFGQTLSLAGPTNTSRALNDALGRPRGGPPVTGLTGLTASKSGTAFTRSWHPSRRETITERASAFVTKKDVARARVLLLSSGVKARQICLRAQLVRPQTPKLLLDSVESHPPETSRALRVPRKDEHMVAAENLISTTTAQTNTFRTAMDHFSTITCPSLHTSLQALNDLVENKLTPRVRAAADDSGELSMKLTTTSTLAVKGLNDVIDGAMRRRRRGPLRWLRRIGYGIVEWLVVGLLWGIWLVVSVLRVVTGCIRGSYMALRWLFWLD